MTVATPDRDIKIKYRQDEKSQNGNHFQSDRLGSTKINKVMHQHDHPQHNHERDRLVSSFDTLGIAASSLCMVHCLAMPFLIGVLPLLGLQFLEGHAAHVTLAGFVVSFALLAIVPSYLKHRRSDILGMMIVGLSLVLYATFAVQYTLGEQWELPLITVGNLILVFTHFRNRSMHRCEVHK